MRRQRLCLNHISDNAALAPLKGHIFQGRGLPLPFGSDL